MIVRDLIAQLEKMPADMPVKIEGCECVRDINSRDIEVELTWEPYTIQRQESNVVCLIGDWSKGS